MLTDILKDMSKVSDIRNLIFYEDNKYYYGYNKL